MNIENYENLSNEVSANLKEQGLTKGEIATVGYLLLSKYYNSIVDEKEFSNKVESLLKKAENLLAECNVNTISLSLYSCSKFSAKQLSEE